MEKKPQPTKKNNTISKPVNKKTLISKENKPISKPVKASNQVKSTVNNSTNKKSKTSNNTTITNQNTGTIRNSRAQQQPRRSPIRSGNYNPYFFGDIGMLGMMGLGGFNSQRGRSQNPNQRGAQNRIDPQRNPVGYLKNFFAGFGIEFPVPEVMNSQITGNRGTNNNRININNVRQQNIDDDIYDPSFNEYGIDFDDTFRNNYSSNFRSNLERDVFEWLLSVIQGNQFEASHNRKPGTKLSVLKKLKKFDLTEKYCKKDDKGEVEYPNCCICICDIKLGEKTVLIPCGHLLHWKCGLLWLKKNNTCPVCRFELPGERRPGY